MSDIDAGRLGEIRVLLVKCGLVQGGVIVEDEPDGDAGNIINDLSDADAAELQDDIEIVIVGNGTGKMKSAMSASELLSGFSPYAEITGLDLIEFAGGSLCRTLCQGLRFTPTGFDRTAIETIFFDPDYASDGSELMHWNADDDNTGSIVAYLMEDGCTITVTYDAPVRYGRFRFNPDSSEMFSDFTSLTEITGLELCSGELIENAALMFHACNELESLSADKLITANCSDISMMFYGCRKLRELSFENWDTSGITDYDQAFSECCRLERISLPAGFVCRDALPVPDGDHIAGATGKWYEVIDAGDADSEMTGEGGSGSEPVGYAPSELPDTAGTYVAVPSGSEDPANPGWSVFELIACEDASGIYSPFGSVYRRYRMYPAGMPQSYVSAVFEFAAAGEKSGTLKLPSYDLTDYRIELIGSYHKAADVIRVDIGSISGITDDARDISAWGRCIATDYKGSL